MDDLDKKILNNIQTAFPIEQEPFKVIGEEIGTSEQEVLIRIKKMKNEGIIRRIGAVFDPQKLGYVSTLCAARVPADKLKEFVEVVNAYTGVTHNYRRNHEYNVWFTFIAPTGEELQNSINEIRQKTGIADILSMRARRTFKIDAKFNF
jgi:DNA-binding Lrp family transcriptional regulator